MGLRQETNGQAHRGPKGQVTGPLPGPPRRLADEAVLEEGRRRTLVEDSGDRHPGGRVGRPQAHTLTFEEWARSWLKSTVHLKPKTRIGYESLLKSHVLPKFGGVRLGEI